MTGGHGWHDEGGFVAGAESLIFGVLIFVLGTLVVVNAWGVIDAKFATSAAAREAVRAVVESDGTSPHATARQAASQALSGHGRDTAGMGVVPRWSGSFDRCEEVGYRVEVTVPALAVFGGVSVGSFTVGSEHYELVEPYRSGLDVDVDEGVTCAF